MLVWWKYCRICKNVRVFFRICNRNGINGLVNGFKRVLLWKWKFVSMWINCLYNGDNFCLIFLVKLLLLVLIILLILWWWKGNSIVWWRKLLFWKGNWFRINWEWRVNFWLVWFFLFFSWWWMVFLCFICFNLGKCFIFSGVLRWRWMKSLFIFVFCFSWWLKNLG